MTSSNAAHALTVLEAKVALDRPAISSRSIDGVPGSQTRSALRAFQSREGLPPTGELDDGTRARLVLSAPALTSYRVEPIDLSARHELAGRVRAGAA